MVRLIAVCVVLALPMMATAGGANTKTGIGDKNGQQCEAGSYFDKSAGKCLAANWI